MVVILPQAPYGKWLDAPPERSIEFMRQFPAEQLAMTAEPLLPPKEPKVKAPRPTKAPPEQPSLF